jgi:hypothetical protein
MDYELAATYNTAAGIGIEVAKADLGSKVKGLDWRLLLLLPTIVSLCFFGFRWIGGRWVQSVIPGVKKSAPLNPAFTPSPFLRLKCP